MKLEEFRQDFLADVDIENSQSGEGRVYSFTKLMLEKLVEYEKIEEYNQAFFEHITNKQRKLRVDAYYLDEVDDSMNLYITDFSGDPELVTLTSSDAKSIFERTIIFLEFAVAGKFEYVDVADRIRYCIDEIRHKFKFITKFRINILTDKILSERVTSFESESKFDKTIEYSVWDMNRVFRMAATNDIDDDYIIDFNRYGVDGIPYLNIDGVVDPHLKSYLSIIPGKVLADIFDEYGSKVLESNVRAFLSAKGKINSGIRATILNSAEKTKFFAYNNGISVTATKIFTHKNSSGSFITGMQRLQIVNGGQTTVSLSQARFRDKADLNGIYVQVKITEIENSENIEIVRNISKFSNSQNKVTDADFYSTSPFAVLMEQFSRRIFAPAVNGNQYETHWFYERAKGQYFVAQSKMTTAEAKKFQMQNPKTQLLTKANIGTYRNIWEQRPHIAKKGAENSLKFFVDRMSQQWDKDKSVFNEDYFKETVAIAILYRRLNKSILKEPWYKQGYAAEVTIYSLSLLAYLFERKGYLFNLRKIWDLQNIDDASFNSLLDIAELVYIKINDPLREIINISEWCKKEACWTSVKNIDFNINVFIQNYAISKNEKVDMVKDAKLVQKMVDNIELQTRVINAGNDFWKDLATFALGKKLLSEKEMEILAVACKMSHVKLPTDKQSAVILSIYEKCLLEGYSKRL